MGCMFEGGHRHEVRGLRAVAAEDARRRRGERPRARGAAVGKAVGVAVTQGTRRTGDPRRPRSWHDEDRPKPRVGRRGVQGIGQAALRSAILR